MGLYRRACWRKLWLQLTAVEAATADPPGIHMPCFIWKARWVSEAARVHFSTTHPDRAHYHHHMQPAARRMTQPPRACSSNMEGGRPEDGIRRFSSGPTRKTQAPEALPRYLAFKIGRRSGSIGRATALAVGKRGRAALSRVSRPVTSQY